MKMSKLIPTGATKNLYIPGFIDISLHLSYQVMREINRKAYETCHESFTPMGDMIYIKVEK